MKTMKAMNYTLEEIIGPYTMADDAMDDMEDMDAMDDMEEVFSFPHAYYARHDPKMEQLLMDHGLAGVGLFWCLVEQLYEQGGELPMDKCKSIAFVLRVDSRKIERIILESGLFQNDGEVFWSDAVRERLNSADGADDLLEEVSAAERKKRRGQVRKIGRARRKLRRGLQ